jgi:Lrp/AsnC family transcriptional regulator, leucine-responsive regulatory protein
MIRPSNPKQQPKTAENIELDELDRRILNTLQIDASLNNNELAVQVHASAPTCLRRVKRLQDVGVIARQVVIVAPEKVGASLTAIVEITLDNQASEKQVEFEVLVEKEAAVLQCYRVSPGPDFVLVVQVVDMPAYHAMAHRLFATHANVRNVRSFFSINRSKFETRIAV